MMWVSHERRVVSRTRLPNNKRIMLYVIKLSKKKRKCFKKFTVKTFDKTLKTIILTRMFPEKYYAAFADLVPKVGFDYTYN